jgi:hypothetical protein
MLLASQRVPTLNRILECLMNIEMLRQNVVRRCGMDSAVRYSKGPKGIGIGPLMDARWKEIEVQ